MKKNVVVLVVVLVLSLALAGAVLAFDVTPPITRVNDAKISAVEADCGSFAVKDNKVEAVTAVFSGESPCTEYTCVDYLEVTVQGGDFFTVYPEHDQFGGLLYNYFGISAPSGKEEMCSPVESLTVHTISGGTFTIIPYYPQFDELMAEYFGQ